MSDYVALASVGACVIRFATGVGITAAGRLNIYASKAGARTFFRCFITIKKRKKAVWLCKTIRQLAICT